MRKNYWKIKGESFDKFYRRLEPFDIENYVKMFLNSRSEVLIDMIKNEKLGKVLDVGCGSGIQMKLIAHKSQFIAGIDISNKMLKLAKNELKYLEKNKWELKVADAHKIPYKNNTFNTIVALGLLDYVKSPQLVLNEFARVLKKRGILIVSAPKTPSLFSLLRTSFGNTIKDKLFGLPPVINIYSKNDWSYLLKNSQFKTIKTRTIWTTMWVSKATKYDK